MVCPFSNMQASQSKRGIHATPSQRHRRGMKSSSRTVFPRTAAPCAISAPAPPPAKRHLVKICGVTSPQDCELAASRGADLIGMIMWPKAKRSVTVDTAAAISAVARSHGAQAVGVFVDETADEIAQRCAAAKLDFAQLHGEAARAALHQLPPSLKIIYVMHATPEGQPDYLLIDGLKGGSGEAFDWKALQIPAGEASHGWLLAGGLMPANVAEAVAVARSGGVDVSSGVCGPDGLVKDADAVSAFITNANAAFWASYEDAAPA